MRANIPSTSIRFNADVSYGATSAVVTQETTRMSCALRIERYGSATIDPAIVTASLRSMTTASQATTKPERFVLYPAKRKPKRVRTSVVAYLQELEQSE